MAITAGAVELAEDRRELLEEVLRKHRPDLVPLVNASRPPTDIEREAILEALADELMLTGLEGLPEDAEMSVRGRKLDELIGVIGVRE